MLKITALFAALLLSRASAQDQGATLFDGRGGALPPVRLMAAPEIHGVPAPNSDWTPANPDDATKEKNPSAPDKERFWEGLQNQILDVCKSADLSTEQDLRLGGFALIGGRVGRTISRYPDGRLAAIDEFSPKAGLSYGQTLFATPQGISGSISVGAQMTDTSVVIRPLATRKTCKELLKLANPLTYKTVLPVRAKRFSEMAVGEIWKMGMAYRIGISPAVGATYQPFTVTLFWSKARENSENISLYRMSPEKLRLRFRIDRAYVTGVGGAVSDSISAAALGWQVGEDLFAKQLGSTIAHPIDSAINGAIAHEVASYFRTALELGSDKRKGEQYVLEFILNPDDQGQMGALAELLKGDFFSLKALARLAKPVDLPDVIDERGRLEKVEKSHSGPLDKDPSFAGADKYDRRGRRLHLKIPIFWDHQGTTTRAEENIVLLDSKGSQINVWQTEKRRGDKFFEIPFAGSYIVHDKWRNAQTFTSREKDGTSRSPAVMYVQQEGFHHQSAATARDMAESADEIMRYVGVKGNGTNSRTTLPVSTLFPKPPEDPNPPMREGQSQSPSEPTYRSAVTALTIVLNQKSIQDILASSTELVIRCYVNSLGESEKATMQKVLGLKDTKIGKDGTIHFNGYALTEGMDRQQEDGLRSEAASLSSTAAKIVKDLAAAREAKTPEKQAEAVSRILSGSGKSGLAYEDILKVLVQLADPLDLSAEFYAQTDKHVKGEKDVKARYILNDRKISDDKLLGEMLEARKRFIPPTKLTD